MSLSRRSFVRTVGAGSAGLLGERVLAGGRVLGPWTRPSMESVLAAQGTRPLLLLHNNENPLGPGERALTAIRAKLAEPAIPAARYSSLVPDLSSAIAARFRCKPENVLVGCGSTQILRTVTQAFASRSRPLVAGIPTYEECSDMAAVVGAPVKGVPGTSTFHHDLDAMAAASRNAGLVFLDNPSNPAATLLASADVRAFVDLVRRQSPGIGIVIDEAYHDYVTDPNHRSQFPLALETPDVLVARTFSKAYGMAGLRVGYAIGTAETINKLKTLHYSQGTNVLGVAAALASIADDERLEQERSRNTAARRHVLEWFVKNGCASTDSQCNFVFVDVKRPAKDFRDACLREDVVVGRDFPPFEKSHVRISIGTLDEMTRALAVFARVLGVKTVAA